MVLRCVWLVRIVKLCIHCIVTSPTSRNCGKHQTQHFPFFPLIAVILSKPDVHLQNEWHTVVLCSFSVLQRTLIPPTPHTDAFLIYSLMFIATAQLNDCVFVSYHRRKRIMRLLGPKGAAALPETFHKRVLMNANGWQASSCDCLCVCYISMFGADRLIANALQSLPSAFKTP